MIGRSDPSRIDIPKGEYLSDHLRHPKRGDVWLLAADTGIGKTTWAAKMFQRSGQKVLILTSLVSTVTQVAAANQIDFWTGDGKSWNSSDGWWAGGGAIICTYDSAEKVAAKIKLSDYVVVFDESHNTAFSSYRAKAINAALNIAGGGAAVVAMSGTSRPIHHPLFENATPITARLIGRPPINATMVAVKRAAGFIMRALRRIDLSGRNVLFYNHKGPKLDHLVARIKRLHPHLNIVIYNSDTKNGAAVAAIIASTKIPDGTLLICTSVFLEGVSIDAIDGLIVASPLTAELLHQLASRARKHLGHIFVWMSKTWQRNEGKEGMDRASADAVYEAGVAAWAERAKGVITDKAFLAAVDTRSLFEFAELAPKITRSKGGSEVMDHVVIDCIAHAMRAAAMSLTVAKEILAEYGWNFSADEEWDNVRIERMNKDDSAKEMTWERIKDMSYDELNELAAKHWLADAKMAGEYAEFLYELADNEELLYDAWLLELGRSVYPFQSAAAAKKLLSIINHARNQHEVYKRIKADIAPGTYDRRELARRVADAAADTFLESELSRLRWFNPSEKSDCKRVLKIITRYLIVESKAIRNEGGALERVWAVTGMAIDSTPIDTDTLTKLMAERDNRIARADRRAMEAAGLITAERVIEPLKTFLDVWVGGGVEKAELKCRTNDDAALVSLRGVLTFCVERGGRWIEYAALRAAGGV